MAAHPPTILQSLSTFSAVYTAAAAVSVAPLVLGSRNNRKVTLKLLLAKIGDEHRRNARLALLPVILPQVFRRTQRFLTRFKDHLRTHTKASAIAKSYLEAFPAIISSSLFVLLPAKLRVQVALYFLTTFLYTFVRLNPRRAIRSLEYGSELQQYIYRLKEELVVNWRKYLPPIWTVSVLSDTWLLWSFLYEPLAFPEGYGNIIVDHSRKYLPNNRNLDDVRRILAHSDHAPSLPSSPHSYVVCEVLHPGQISCTANFVSACIEEATRAAPWVAGFTTLGMAVSGRSLFKKGIFKLLFQFVDSTIRGTAYIAGTITTAWALTCALQRVLPRGQFSQTRWLINGSLSSVWILLLSRSRQVAISLYQMRLAIHSVWKVWKSRGGRSVKNGDIWLIALCWAGLILVKRRTEENRISGMVGQVMRMIDGTEYEDFKKQGSQRLEEELGITSK